MNKLLSKRSAVVFAVLLATFLMGIYLETRPQIAPGQPPLTDIQDIGPLRTQFNQDIGKIRLILLVSPT